MGQVLSSQPVADQGLPPNSWLSVCSLPLSAGVWQVFGTVHFESGGGVSGASMVQIFDGSTEYNTQAPAIPPTSGQISSITTSAVLTLLEDAVVWLRARADSSGWGIITTCQNPLAPPNRDATKLTAVQLSGSTSDEPAPDALLSGSSSPITSGSTQDPINTLTGNYRYQRVDVTIPGRGPAPRFVRAYNSLDTRVGAMGPGWTHNYAVRLRSPGDGTQDLFLVRENGQTDRYTPNGDGTYSPPASVQATLAHQCNGTYMLTLVDQTVQVFDSPGNLIAIVDRSGNRSELSYNAAGQLTRVADPAGRGALVLGYDPTSGLLTSVTDWLDRVVQYGYDTSGRLETVTDRLGKVTTFGYDGTSQRIATITDANSHVAITMTYDAAGRVAAQQDARGLITGEETSLAYVTNPDGTQTTTVTYPTTSFDPSWHPLQIDTYDADNHLVGRVLKPTSNAAEDVSESYTYDANGFRASVTDGRGNVTAFCFDIDYSGVAVTGSRGNLTRRISPPPAPDEKPLVTLFQYDDKNNLTQIIPPKGVGNGGTVDCSTNLSGVIDPNYATRLGYDATQTLLVSVTRQYTDPDLGPMTAVTKMEYGDSTNPGLVTRVIPPRGNTSASPDDDYATSFAYGQAGPKAGLLLAVTDPLGNQTAYDYDTVGRRTSMVDPNGNVPGSTTFTAQLGTAVSRLANIQLATTGADPSAHLWRTEYDAEDRVRFVHSPAPTPSDQPLTTEFRYDDVGNRTGVIDANGQVTLYGYDERDSLHEVQQSPSVWTDPDSPPTDVIVTAYGYDNAGSLSRVTRATGDSTYERGTDYVYDGLNRARAEIQYPAWPTTTPTMVTTYAYDPTGNRISMTDPLGQTTIYLYDAVNRLTGIRYGTGPFTGELGIGLAMLADLEPGTGAPAGGETPSVSYTYDANGNRTSMADGTGSTFYSYDELDRLLSVTSPGAVTVGYRYDFDGNRVKLIYPDGDAVAYVFDRADRLTGLTDWAGRIVRYAYRPDGSLDSSIAPNGGVAAYSYDNALRLTRVWNQLMLRPPTAELGVPNALLGDIELGSVQGQQLGTVSQHTYTLDAVGNRTQLTEVLPVLGPPGPIGTIVTTDYSYDRLYRLTSTLDPDVTTGYTYDPVGNRLTMIRGSTTSYSYDRADRILTAGAVSYTVDANGNMVTRGSDSFRYDQANRLTSAIVGGASVSYTYDGDGKRVSKTVAGVSTGYIYDVNRGLPALLDDGTLKYVWGFGLACSVLKTTGRLLTYHSDGLGSIRSITDPDGTVSETYQTDEFGTPTVTTGSIVQPFQFTGEQRDSETGFVYLRSRLYDPILGRFMQRDNAAGYIGLPASLNRYSYALNQPIRWTDPAGRGPAAPQVLTPTPTPGSPQAGLLPYSASTCGQIEMDIQNLVNELQQRKAELEADRWELRFYNWYTPHPRYGSVQGHLQQFSDKQAFLNRKLNEWSDNQCWRNPNQPQALISQATQWGNAPAPTPPPGGPLIGPPVMPGATPPSVSTPYGWDPTGIPWWVYVLMGIGTAGPPDPYQVVPGY